MTVLVLRLFAAVLGAASLLGAARPLPRHAVFGAVTAPARGGVAIAAVVPGMPAARAGLRPGDVIAAVGARRITSVADFTERVRRAGAGPVEVSIRRGGAVLRVRVVLAAAASEHDPAVDTNYEQIEVDGSARRTLVTMAHGASGVHPAALIAGGIGCYTIDAANATANPYAHLAHDLSRRGIVVMRLEKSGVGDSRGPPCLTVDYAAEYRSYLRAFDALRAHAGVDPARVYVIGHSIGTVIAPSLAHDRPAAGIVAAEGTALNWFEYELINARRQEALGGASPADVDRALQVKERCMHRLLVEKRSRAAVVRADPACADATAYPASDAYMQQVAALNLAAAWSAVHVPVLAIYGSADFITDEADHRRIVAIVNRFRPRTASLALIPGMDHVLTRARTQRASLDAMERRARAAPYDARFSATVAEWLCRRARCSPRTGP